MKEVLSEHLRAPSTENITVIISHLMPITQVYAVQATP